MTRDTVCDHGTARRRHRPLGPSRPLPGSFYARGMATPVSASTTIAAPPSTVFAILADARQHPRIDGSGTVLGLADGPDQIGRAHV